MQPDNSLAIVRQSLDLDQYAGLWAIEEVRFMQMFDRVSKMDLLAHVAAHQGPIVAAAGSMVHSGDIAVIDIVGTMTKRGSSLSTAGATSFIRRQVRDAADSADVAGIMLRIESPGGTVSGTQDLADDVAAAAAKKPVTAFVEDLCASAAYWVASQCTRIVANNASAWVGSIGTFMGLYDFSAAATMAGIKPVVIKTGSHKGAGFPGTEITAEQREAWQALVDDTQVEFSGAISRGRKLSASKVRELADGRVFMASTAKSHGLIDAIEPYDKAMQQLRKASAQQGKQAKQTGTAAVAVRQSFGSRLLGAARPPVIRSPKR